MNNILENLIDYVIANKASDLHLSAQSTPMARIDGEICSIKGFGKLSRKDMEVMLDSVMSEGQRKYFRDNFELDFAVSGKNNCRFRVNTFFNRYGPAAVFREIPSKQVSLIEISAPGVLTNLCKLHQGLILVTGPTGSGKSTTLAAMINHINENYKRHIITIEDPIEFTYENSLSLVNQREVGSATKSFPNALRSALREDPDVILVGEMRDLETIRLALTAAETGHLVFGTLHTNSAAQSVNRIVDVFPSQDKDLVRSMLSSSLKSIVSQRLVKKNGGGRAAVYEVMLANKSIRNLIKEDKIPQINSMIEIGKKQGMVTAKDSVMNLFNNKIIDKETAQRILNSLDN